MGKARLQGRLMATWSTSINSQQGRPRGKRPSIRSSDGHVVGTAAIASATLAARRNGQYAGTQSWRRASRVQEWVARERSFALWVSQRDAYMTLPFGLLGRHLHRRVRSGTARTCTALVGLCRDCVLLCAASRSARVSTSTVRRRGK